MTEQKVAFTYAQVIEAELDEAHFVWARRHRGKKTAEEALHNLRSQTIQTITHQPGGRLLCYTEVFGKRHSTKTTTYNRYQHIPGSGYVLVFHRDM